jgi:hypothetical protein
LSIVTSCPTTERAPKTPQWAEARISSCLFWAGLPFFSYRCRPNARNKRITANQRWRRTSQAGFLQAGLQLLLSIVVVPDVPATQIQVHSPHPPLGSCSSCVRKFVMGDRASQQRPKKKRKRVAGVRWMTRGTEYFVLRSPPTPWSNGQLVGGRPLSPLWLKAQAARLRHGSPLIGRLRKERITTTSVNASLGQDKPIFCMHLSLWRFW